MKLSFIVCPVSPRPYTQRLPDACPRHVALALPPGSARSALFREQGMLLKKSFGSL